MKLRLSFLFLSILFYSCNTRQSQLTSKSWLLKEYNTTINSKKNKNDKANYLDKYKRNFTINFSSDYYVTIDLEGKETIKLNWKWINNKDDIVIYRENNFDVMSRFENIFYGEYFISNISTTTLKLTRIIIPFEEDEEFIFEKLH